MAVKVRGMYLQNPSDEQVLIALRSSYIIVEMNGVLHCDMSIGVDREQKFKGSTVHHLRSAGGWRPLPENFEDWCDIVDLTACSVSDPFNN